MCCRHDVRLAAADPYLWLTACRNSLTFNCHTYHRYSIEQLADPAPGGAGDFVESCYLLLNGELPTPEEKKKFNYDITRHSMVPEQLIQFYKVGHHSLSALTFSSSSERDDYARHTG